MYNGLCSTIFPVSYTHLKQKTVKISTHTLRGERDLFIFVIPIHNIKFQLTRSVGSVTMTCQRLKNHCKFQLTRSVGSVTLHIVYVKSHHHNRADILLKITLKIDIFYIICIIFSANLHINCLLYTSRCV